MEIITSTVNGIDKLLTVVNSTKKLLILGCLVSLTGVSFLGHKLIESNSIVDSFAKSKIERVGGNWCYQRKKGGVTKSREIGIQFPISKELQALGVAQSMTGFVVDKEPTLSEFHEICDLLVQEVMSERRQDYLLKHYPESKQKMIEYFRKLEALDKKTASAKSTEQS